MSEAFGLAGNVTVALFSFFHTAQSNAFFHFIHEIRIVRIHVPIDRALLY